MSVVRYADGAVLGFERKEEAEQFLVAAAERMQRFGLRLHPEKTKLLPFGTQAAKRAHHNRERGSSFDFLGFTHYMGRTLIIPSYELGVARTPRMPSSF